MNLLIIIFLLLLLLLLLVCCCSLLVEVCFLFLRGWREVARGIKIQDE